MFYLKTSFSKAQIEAAIRSAIASLPPGTKTVDSDGIIPILLGQPHYVQDFGIPAGQSTNAAIGREIRAVGEDSGIIQKQKKVSKEINGSLTTVTRYKIV